MKQKSFDKEITSSDFQLDGAHLVEASAGTGKTYNIQNIYVRLITEKGLKVSEILVMTFTEAATKELRDRLHAVLKDVQRRFAGQDCLGRNPADSQARNDRADRLIACVPEEKRIAARANVELALLEIDRSAISTIHGFCQRVLSRYAFEAGISLTPTIEDNKKEELKAMAEDWWRRRPADMPDGVTLDTLCKYILRLSGKADYEVMAGDLSRREGYALAVAQELVGRYEASRAERPALNFDDLLRALRDALKPEQPQSRRLTEQLRMEFKAALIDEFQDTDPVQYEIFERIFLSGNPNPLFFVGDPKQAIYAFRGADIYTYLKAKGNPALSRFSLGVNYRSTRRMIDAINGMFRDSDGRRTFGQEEIPYGEVCVEKEPDKVRGTLLDRPLRLALFPVRSTSLSLENCMPRIADLMVLEINALLKETKTDPATGKAVPVFAPGDIAILTNSNPRNLEIHQRLLAAHIPSVVRKSGNVFSSPVAKELWIFLQAVASPSEKEILRCAETTVFGAGSGMMDLEAPEALSHIVGRYRILNEKWRRRGLAAVMAELEETEGTEYYRQKLARREDGERQLSDLAQLWELCSVAVKQRGLSLDELVTWLDERIRAAGADEAEAEEYFRELESDRNAVKIMTVHLSKGLQFPVVFLPDCWSVGNASMYKPYEYHSQNGLVFSVDEKSAKELAKSEAEQEKTRLLYVALTRAVERMVLFSPWIDRKHLTQKEIVTVEKKAQRGAIVPLLNNLRANCAENPPYEEVLPRECADAGVYSPAEPEMRWREVPAPPEFDPRPSKGSFSSLFPGKTAPGAEPDARDWDEGEQSALAKSPDGNPEDAHRIFRVRSGADIGSCWHSILEKIPFEADETAIREAARRELSYAGFLLAGDDETLEATVEMVTKTLDYEMLSPDGGHFSLREIPWGDRLSEQEFDLSSAEALPDTGALKEVLERHWGRDPAKAEFLRSIADEPVKPMPRGFLTGFVDLIFRHEGFYYIVDWKSNSIGGERENFNDAGICAEMARHRYFFQYLLYAVVLHFYLKQTLGEDYSWERHFGGIRYCFLRGIAAGGEASVYADRPSEAMLEELGRAFGLTEAVRR